MRFITYRAFPQPTISLYSRTSYLGYIGGLDMLLAHKLAQMACDMLTADGLTTDQIAFRWHCDMWQFHGFKSMAYLFDSGQDKLMRVKKWPEDRMGPVEDWPTWKLIRSWWKRIATQDADGKPYAEMKYGAEKRIRRRYHAQVGIDQTPYLTTEKAYGKLSTPIEMVSLDSSIYASPESRAIVKRQRKKRSVDVVKSLFGDTPETEEEFDPLPVKVVQDPKSLFDDEEDIA